MSRWRIGCRRLALWRVGSQGLACAWRDARWNGCNAWARARRRRPQQSRRAVNEGARWCFVRTLCQEAKYRSTAADALLGKSLLRRPPIHLIPLSARSFAMGGVYLSKRARFGVEGRSPCRGQATVSRAGRRVDGWSPCRWLVAVSRLRGNLNFQKKLVDL